MRTRRHRGSGFGTIASAAFGNISNGGGRLAQFNVILNGVKDWRKFKRMLVVMGGDDINDPKWASVNLKDNAPASKAEEPLDKKVLEEAVDATVKAEEGTKVQGGTRKNKRNRI